MVVSLSARVADEGEEPAFKQADISFPRFNGRHEASL
jgi:hypothetical protein